MSYWRSWIAPFLLSLSMINYMDHIALSIAAKPIESEFKLTSVGMRYLFSSFIWSYALFFVWSAATGLTGAASTCASLMVARLVMSAGESTSNPVGAKVVRQWVPVNEHGMVTSTFNSGSYAEPAICSVMLGLLTALLHDGRTLVTRFDARIGCNTLGHCRARSGLFECISPGIAPGSGPERIRVEKAVTQWDRGPIGLPNRRLVSIC